ncbi:hypothetical protein RHODGE_RHODGE_03736 [Rhodoplanes serenus]|uniref:Translation initiation factor IF-2 n=1 Tax=Rhodoplanes serenus TaxID=200615 RepID=A0A447CZ06_9BRAD|nr:hypothetical protein [Rhodoplanes serenus]VCU10537.1 hypothetical protein RHODGE_RHODGE_03736 [Rhodoplanes serenus]
MPSTSKLFRAGLVALGVTALAMPALAQTGNPNNPTGTEVPNNVPPKGNIGTSGDTGAAARGSGGAVVAPVPGTTGAGGAGGPAARDSGPALGDPPSQVPRAGPKGNIGGN